LQTSREGTDLPLAPVRPYNSLYIHIPFCVRQKCDYCAFYSEPHGSPALHRQFLSALERELARNAPACQPLRSIFIGGGTPSALAPQEITRLSRFVHAILPLAPDCEWTFEANPASLTPARLEAMLAGGANRLSLGIQSFSPRLRRVLGRRGILQRLPDILREIRCLPSLRLNLDLIFQIPGESITDWQNDLQRALDCQPDHLSAYSLIREPGTAFLRRHPDLPEPDDGEFLQFWNLTDKVLATAGLHRYEISNFARRGCRCRHNYEIWHGQTYLGCGPAAVSFNGQNRPANPASLTAWLQNAPQEDDILPAKQRAREILAFGLRTTDGWNREEFTSLTGYAPEQLAPQALARLQRAGLLKISPLRLSPTHRGLLVNDGILEQILNEE